MLSQKEWSDFAERFPALASNRRAATLIRQFGQLKVVGEKEILYRDGDDCTHLPMMMHGELVLIKHGDTGRSITLYRVEDGESCILSTLSILNNAAFPAEASAAKRSTLLLIPAAILRELVEDNAAWRGFVFTTYHQRLAGLIVLIEEVVFEKLDRRLAVALVEKPQARFPGSEDAIVRTTHHDLATEMGTSREVVSRILKEWEHRGFVSLSRGAIHIVDGKELRKIATESD